MGQENIDIYLFMEYVLSAGAIACFNVRLAVCFANCPPVPVHKI